MASLISQKKQTSYRIHFSVSQFASLGVLFSLSLIFSFYLGLVTGKSIRPSNEIASFQKAKTKENATLPAEQLSFFKSIEGESEKKNTFSTEQLEKLKNTTDRITKKQVLAKQEKTPPPPPLPKQETPKTKPKVATQNPTPTPLVAAKKTGTYTLQVFTSGNKKTAETWVKRLKESGYLEAYLHSYVTENQKTLYRVRIAKTSKTSAESLAGKLQQLDFIDHVQITRL